MLKQLEGLNKIHNKRKAVIEAKKPKINLTAKFHFFQRVSEPEH